MGGDYTRLTFDPGRDHASVRMQQGRVQLDSDWNELVDILERRARAATLDVLGPCAVPVETPDGFRIRIDDGTLTIGAGRLYVDGLLVENHGDPTSTRLDPLLGEVAGAAPVAYDRQPYLPAAPRLPAEGPAIVYADAWLREITAVEDPALIERALGVDTATRLQAVWQVRALPVNAESLTPAEVERTPEWRALLRPPAGRLTTAAVNASGAFSGGENRLYRVEIHDRGEAGGATFKWSSSNGSAVAPVRSISADRTRVGFVARPGVTFAPGDWVEVLDDALELLRLPGVMAHVLTVDAGTSQLTLADALPDQRFDAGDPSRRTRVRRWDQKGEVHDAEGRVHATVDACGGVIPIPADGRQLVLEDGIGVTFGVGAHPVHHQQPGRRRVRIIEEDLIVEAEDGFVVVEIEEVEEVEEGGRRRRRRRSGREPYRSGDFWTFAARADGWLETLDQAPPRGVYHHYCPLAIVTPPERAVDCRVMWPPERRGAAGVGAAVALTAAQHAAGGLTVQQAVDRVRTTGGTVRLDPGVYVLDRPLDLGGARSVRLTGSGWATVLLFRGQEPALRVEGAIGLSVEDLTVVAADPGTAPATGRPAHAPSGASGPLARQWAALSAAAGHYTGGSAAALSVRDSAAVAVRRCNLLQLVAADASVPAVALEGALVGFSVTGSTVLGAAGVGNAALVGPGTGEYLVAQAAALESGPVPYLLTVGLEIADNELWCSRRGISLEGMTLHASETRIAGNRVRGCTEAGIAATGFVGSGAGLHGHRLTIEENLVRAKGDGIVVGTDRSRVAGNDVSGLDEIDFTAQAPVSQAAAGAPRGADQRGVVVTRGLRLDRTDDCAVARNRVENVAGHGVAVDAPVGSLLVEGNTISSIGGMGVEMAEASSAKQVTVRDNRLEDVIRIPHDAAVPVAAIRLRQTDSAEVSGNTVLRVGQTLQGQAGRSGVQLLGCAAVRVARNELRQFGQEGAALPESAGIDITQPFDEVRVADNVVRIGTGHQQGGSFWRALRIGAPTVAQAQAMVRAPQPGVLTRILQRFGGNAATASTAATPPAPAPGASATELVSVRGNLLETAGSRPTVEIDIVGPCTFTENRCLRGQSDGSSPLVSVSAGVASFVANHVPSAATDAAVQIDTTVKDGVASVGNIVPGRTSFNAQEVSAL